MIFLLLCLLLWAALFMLTIWPTGPPPLVPTAVDATQGALFRLERWSDYWCLPLNPSKCEASSFSVDPHQANLQPSLLLFNFFRFNSTPTFLGVIFDRTLSFSKHVSLMKAKFFPRLKALRCISASSWVPSKEPISLFCIKLFFGLFSLMNHRIFSLSVLPISPKWNAFTVRLVAHHRLPLVVPYSTSSLRGFFTTLTSHSDSLYSFILRAGSSSPNLLSYFRFGQTWSETKTLRIFLESLCVHLPAHAPSSLF